MELSRAEALIAARLTQLTQRSGKLSSSSSCLLVPKVLPAILLQREVLECIQAHSQWGISKPQVTWWVTETSGEVDEGLLPIPLPSLQVLMTPLTVTPCTAAR